MSELKKYCKLAPIKAIIVRLVFAAHSLVAIYRVVEAYDNNLFWLLLISLLGLIVETIITLVKRSGREWTWFSPAIFCYLISAVPSIWLLEIQLSQVRVQLTNLTQNGSFEGIRLIESIEIDIPLDLAGWALAMEQALLFLLILGRWFMPKGNITKNQLSQILLVYIGMAADIMELFEVFKEDEVALSHYLTYPTLSLWTIALLQYTLVISTTKAKKTRYGDIGDEESIADENNDEFSPKRCGLDSVNIDILGITTTIVMQDGPFLCYRLYLLVGLGVTGQMMVFFTCKNLLVIILQVYRLAIIYCESKKDEDDTNETTRGSSSFGNETNSLNLSGENRNATDTNPRQKHHNNYNNAGKDYDEIRRKLSKSSNNRVTPTPPEAKTNPARLSWENDTKNKPNLNHPNALSDPVTPLTGKKK